MKIQRVSVDFFFLGFLSLVVKLTKSSILSERKLWPFVGVTDYKFYHTPSMVCVVENHVRDGVKKKKQKQKKKNKKRANHDYNQRSGL